MPRELKFSIDGKEFVSYPSKIDRRKLYGWTELMATDENGERCDLLTVDESGKYIIPLGGTGIGILSDKGMWIERSELKTVDADGRPARVFESSFSVVNELRNKVTPEEFLDHSITDFYELSDASGEMFRAVGDGIYVFEYTYNDSFSPSPAFVMASQGTMFLLVAVRNQYEWVCFGSCETIDDDYADELIDEGNADIDFSMF